MQPAKTPVAIDDPPRPALLAGVDIGGTKIAAVLVSRSGDVLASHTEAAPTRGGGAVLRAVAATIESLEREVGSPIAALGLGAAGIIDSATGTVLAASQLFTDWVGRRIGAELEALIRRPVTVANDVNAFLVGEVRWGALRGAENALGVMLGTGVGGAVMLAGHLFEGPHGGAGEIGHTPRHSDQRCTCGGIGHLETVASGRSIGLRYAERTGGSPLTGQETARRAASGDEVALAVFHDAGQALANAVLTTGTLFDVDHVVIGGGVAKAWEFWRPSFEATVAENPPVSGRQLIVRLAALTNPAIGAATLALDTVDSAGDMA
ncbi:ROK family protein [Tessaracoccus sp. MC1756]|uniref:ROK family protein n=1 Tax=Tessaracoccus sp. MC1756 TaxID=2760311 RepID=UPI001C71931C